MQNYYVAYLVAYKVTYKVFAYCGIIFKSVSKSIFSTNTAVQFA